MQMQDTYLGYKFGGALGLAYGSDGNSTSLFFHMIKQVGLPLDYIWTCKFLHQSLSLHISKGASFGGVAWGCFCVRDGGEILFGGEDHNHYDGDLIFAQVNLTTGYRQIRVNI